MTMTRDDKFEANLNWNLTKQGHGPRALHVTPHGMERALRERGVKTMTWQEYREIRLGRGRLTGERLELAIEERAAGKLRALRRAGRIAHYPAVGYQGRRRAG